MCIVAKPSLFQQLEVRGCLLFEPIKVLNLSPEILFSLEGAGLPVSFIRRVGETVRSELDASGVLYDGFAGREDSEFRGSSVVDAELVACDFEGTVLAVIDEHC